MNMIAAPGIMIAADQRSLGDISDSELDSVRSSSLVSFDGNLRRGRQQTARQQVCEGRMFTRIDHLTVFILPASCMCF